MKKTRAEIANDNMELLQERDPQVFAEFISNKNSITGNYEIGDELFRMPERIGEALSFSMTLIDHNHTGTWGDYGYIFGVPKINVLAAGSHDIGSTNRPYAVYEALKHGPSIAAPQKILGETDGDSYNEIWAISSLRNSNISIDGIFYKVNRDNQPVSAAILPKLLEQARRLRVPVVPIPEPEVKDSVSTLSSGWIVTSAGVRYELKKNRDFSPGMFFPFQAQVSKRQRYFMSKDELHMVSRLLASNGISEADLQNLMIEYVAADVDYHAVKLRKQADGKIITIEKLIGHGTGEETIHIHSNGFCYRANSRRLREYYSELVMCKDKPAWSPFKSFSVERLGRIVQEAAQKNPQEAKEIMALAGLRSVGLEHLDVDEMMKFITASDLH